uniref:Uncharacterized protein n=1 Tax=Pseudomonas fluorescens (strain SBW25) TaxID=216595 RepID=A0A0G4E5M0_PSEFS|nr:hypothetical protein PQBR55_0126 [Pseudomonas fluorescens SBW25]
MICESIVGRDNVPSNDTRYCLPVTLDQLQSLQSILDAVSAREANPDAEVFHLLEVVRK